MGARGEVAESNTPFLHRLLSSGAVECISGGRGRSSRQPQIFTQVRGVMSLRQCTTMVTSNSPSSSEMEGRALCGLDGQWGL